MEKRRLGTNVEVSALPRLVVAFTLTLALAGCPSKPVDTGTPLPAGDAAPSNETHVKHVDVPPAIRAVVDAPDRDPEDKKLDAGRKPAELLAFAGIKPGMKVADLAAGGGYSTELLARAVGPTGVVYGQNSAMLLEKFAEKPWAARLAKPADKNVLKVTRDFDDPLPPEAKDLDAVIFVLFYHDTFWMQTDRQKMNAAVFRALKPGGVYLIVDHSGRSGTGAKEVKTLHRIEESVVRSEVPRAGFKLTEDADFLRNADDKRDWSASPGDAAEKRGTSDRFVLKFVKP